MHLWTVFVIVLVWMIFSAIIHSGNRKVTGLRRKIFRQHAEENVGSPCRCREDGPVAAGVAPDAAKASASIILTEESSWIALFTYTDLIAVRGVFPGRN